jgi:hypothetical protein
MLIIREMLDSLHAMPSMSAMRFMATSSRHENPLLAIGVLARRTFVCDSAQHYFY